MGFRGPVQKLFKSYLQDRKQYVQIGQNKSYLRSIMCGVPQGSVVGPLFFILYVNDLPNAAISRVSLFADDTTVLERIPNFNLSIFNQPIRDNDTWMRKIRLKCNIDKSKAVVFANKVNLGLNFEEYQIAINPQLKYLGIVIDDKLTFCDHVLRLKNKLLFCNYIVLRTRNYLTRSQLLFYYTHVNPIIQYGILIYGCTAYSNLDPVLKVQKRIIRNICFIPKYASVSDYMVANELPTVYELHFYELLKFIVKSIRCEHQYETFNSLLVPRCFGYELRSAKRNEVCVPFGKTRKLDHSLQK